jgi:hypothetical protein
MTLNQTISSVAASNPYVGLKLAAANTTSLLLAETIGAGTTSATTTDSGLQNLLTAVNTPTTASLPSSVAAAGTTTAAALDPNQNPALAVADTQSNVAGTLLSGVSNLGTLLDTTA